MEGFNPEHIWKGEGTGERGRYSARLSSLFKRKIRKSLGFSARAAHSCCAAFFMLYKETQTFDSVDEIQFCAPRESPFDLNSSAQHHSRCFSITDQCDQVCANTSACFDLTTVSKGNWL